MLLIETNKQKNPLTIILAEGDISWNMGYNDDGQHDKTEHEQKDDKVECDQEAQKGEVRQDPCSKHP